MRICLVGLLAWVGTALGIAADPQRVVFLFTDVPAGAHVFLDGADLTARAEISAAGWRVTSDVVPAGQSHPFACAFHFDEKGAPQVAKMEVAAKAGEVLQISLGAFTREAVAGPPAPGTGTDPNPPAKPLPDRAIIQILVPRTTKLTINDAPTIQEGERREFFVKLAPGEQRTYHFYIDFRDSTGRQFIRTKDVTVKAGDVVSLTVRDFGEEMK